MKKSLQVIVPWILQTLVWIPTRITLKLLYKLEVRGLNNIKQVDKGVIFAANHTSELDPVLLPASLPFLSRFAPIFYTCLEKKFYKDRKFGWRRHIYGGRFFNAWGAYEVTLGIRSYDVSLKNHIEIIRSGHSVLIFPEGRKNKTGKTEAKGGVAYLSYVTKAPIIPIKINGAVDKKKITFSFGKPIYPTDLFPQSGPSIISDERDDYKKAAKLIMENIDQLA